MMSIGGIALGLFIAKSLIEAHGGRICAENNTDTGGDFYFLLYTEDIASYNKLCNSRTSRGSNFNELLNPLVNQTMVTAEGILIKN
jgi:hypothetical protein